MKQEFPYWKMHGAGNDFILVDDREATFPAEATEWLAGLCARDEGIGSDGAILIQTSATSDFRMRFFNPDGREAEMCGNGARCVARLARELGVAPAEMEIETMAGGLRAEALGELVRLHMTDPFDWRLGAALRFPDGSSRPYGHVNTGVPHAVFDVGQGLADVDVAGDGRTVREHADFAPAGTNANFIEITGPQSLSVRTYERGVEAETLACGTGIVASALIAAKDGKVSSPVAVTCRHGDVLEVSFQLTEDSASDVQLLGPAAHIHQGQLSYEG